MEGSQIIWRAFERHSFLGPISHPSESVLSKYEAENLFIYSFIHSFIYVKAFYTHCYLHGTKISLTSTN